VRRVQRVQQRRQDVPVLGQHRRAGHPPVIPPLTVTSIREMGQTRLEKLHKPRLIEGINACMALINFLESGSEVSKVRSELKELKLSVFTNASAPTSTTVCAVTQDTQDVLDRPNIGWDAKEQNPSTATPNAVEDPPLPQPRTGRGKQQVKAGQAGQACEDLWCLSPFVPVTQEARDKPRKVCPLNLRGEVCTADNCGNKHPKVCLVADHSKGKIPKATCSLWHMRIPFAGNAGGAGNAGNATRRRNSSNHPFGSKGSKAKVAAWPVKLDAKLAKLTATAMAEELKARIRTTKLMSQGVSYSQMVQAHAPAPTSAPAPAPALAPASNPTSVAPRTARKALTPDEAVRILLDVVNRLQQ
jgi:hypothetical protein